VNALVEKAARGKGSAASASRSAAGPVVDISKF
jgi:hypothetical protein